MKALIAIHPVFQCVDHHFGPQVRAANADIDDIGDLRIAAYLVCQSQHLIQRFMYIPQCLVHVGRPGANNR